MANVAILTEDIRIALDDLLDAVHKSEARMDLVRVRADSVSTQLRCLEDEINAAKTLKAQQGAA